MTPWKTRSLFTGAAILLALPACQTSKPSKTPNTEVTAPQPVTGFRPATAVSRLHAGAARYPNLYTTNSFAVWVSPEIAEMKKQKETEGGTAIDEDVDAAAKLIGERYFVIECHVQSIFPDTSIAYDAVGLRNIDVYLSTPDGLNVRPIQRVLGSHADEEQHEALKQFSRSSILVFPKQDIMVNTPTIDVAAPGVRLVLEGFNSTFYFEWPNAASVGGEAAGSQAVEALKVGFSELFSKLVVLSHIFD